MQAVYHSNLHNLYEPSKRRSSRNERSVTLQEAQAGTYHYQKDSEYHEWRE
jgi:hypothetical protein